MKVVSFIGQNRAYQPCCYRYGDKEVQTHLFPFAVTQFFETTSLLVFLTPKAAKAKASFKPEEEEEAKRYFKGLAELYHLPSLTARDQTYFEQLCEIHLANGLVEPQPIPIPNGESEPELWEIFKTLADKLNEGEEVIFDITHAFRSLPLLAFIAAAYLRKTKDIRLKAIVYGALEAAYNKEDGTRITPVFDLTPFVDLLDWMTATEQFRETGNANLLAQMLKAKEGSAESLANKIQSLSQGLRLLRPLQVMRESAELPQAISSAKAEVTDMVPPFAELIDRVSTDYGKFGLATPDDKKQDAARLLKQLDLAEWYFEKRQIVQSLAMMREWIPSLMCYRLRLDPLEHKERIVAESLLNGYQAQINGKYYSWSQVARSDGIKKSCNILTDLRNDVLHAGLSRQPRSYQTVITRTGELIDKLREIASRQNLSL
jgi:CRISPR-associated Csx2 family protein